MREERERKHDKRKKHKKKLKPAKKAAKAKATERALAASTAQHEPKVKESNDICVPQGPTATQFPA